MDTIWNNVIMKHYFSEKQESRLRLRKIEDNLRGNYLDFYTGSGVFSPKRIDPGSRLLIESSIIKDTVLDLGCGYGAVGIAIKKKNPSVKVVMTDVNKRAVKLCMKNIKLNNVDADVLRGNLFEKIDRKFDTILVNPPQKAGKEICFKIIEDSINYLNKGGSLQLVARHNKGGKSLEKKMKNVFGNVKAIAKKSGYRVYVSELTTSSDKKNN